MQNLKKLLYSALTCTFLLNLNIPVNATEKEVREKFEKKALMEAEEETWKLIKDSDNKDDLEYFIKQFPNSPYTIPAKLKLNQLNKN